MNLVVDCVLVMLQSQITFHVIYTVCETFSVKLNSENLRNCMVMTYQGVVNCIKEYLIGNYKLKLVISCKGIWSISVCLTKCRRFDYQNIHQEVFVVIFGSHARGIPRGSSDLRYS